MSRGMPEELALVEQRLDFLELLDRPHGKGSIVDSLDHSRSTVDRAVRSLVDAGLVEETGEGYVRTVAGRLATERYRQFQDEQRSIMAAREVLASLPPECDLPASVLSSDRTETEREPALFELVGSLLAGASRYAAVLPRVADPRHLRLFSARTERTGLSASLLAPDRVLDQIAGEFPSLSVDLADSPDVTVVETTVPPYGLVLIEGADGATLLVVAYEDGTPTGVVRTDDEQSVAWARGELRRLRNAGTDATERLRAVDAGDDVAVLAGGEGLSPRLRSEGFVRVDDAYFDDRAALDPVTGWRAGLALPEVAAGYAVERRTGDGERLSASLLDRLRDGADVALLGPPGSGKSTVCKQVAYEWFDADDGPVLYREGGTGQPFESVEALVATLDAAAGRPLVVVEDAVRADAAAVFEVIERLGDRGAASFLLDSRESEWHDTDSLAVDSRYESVHRTAVETVSMPTLDEAECRQVADHLAELTGDQLQVEPGDLLADIRGVDDAAGSTYLFFDRLARYVDPLATYEGSAPTTLDEDVDGLRAALRAAGETALDAGVLVNVLNASDRRVRPAAVHALAVADDETSHDDVAAALSLLDGRVVFPDDDGYRTVHGSWSVRFLERLADDDDAEARFGRVLSALLALADDPERRERLAEAVPDAASYVETIEADPAAWAGDLMEAVFEVGREHSGLVALFGSVDGSSLTVPAACPETTRLRCVRWRGDMYTRQAAYEAAAREYEYIVETLPAPAEADTDERARLHLSGLIALGRAMVAGGRTEQAAEHAEEGLAAARRIGDAKIEARALSLLARIETRTGELDRAMGHYEEVQRLCESIGDRSYEVRAAHGIGQIAWQRNEFDAARERLRSGLALARETGNREGELRCQASLAGVVRDQGDLETSVRYYTESLELARTLGERDSELAILMALGNVATQRGRLDDAVDYHEQGLEIAREIGQTRRAAEFLLFRSDAELQRDATGAAVTLAREAVDLADETGHPMETARARARLARALLRRGDVEAAAETASTALETSTELEYPPGVGQSHWLLGLADLERDALPSAASHLQAALDATEGTGKREIRTRVGLATLATRRGETETADDHLQRATELAREYRRETDLLTTVDRLLDAAEASGAREAATRWTETAIEVAADAGIDHVRAALEDRLASLRRGEPAED